MSMILANPEISSVQRFDPTNYRACLLDGSTQSQATSSLHSFRSNPGKAMNKAQIRLPACSILRVIAFKPGESL